MKKIVLALATVAALSCSMPVMAQSANEAMRYDEAHDPAYREAMRHHYYGSYGGGYGSYYGGTTGYIANDVVSIVGCLLLCHRPNPVKDNTAKINGIEYKACDGDPAVSINMRCGYPQAAAAPTAPASRYYWEGGCLVTVTIDAAGNQTPVRQCPPPACQHCQPQR